MICSLDFKPFYTCDTCYNTAYIITFFGDKGCFIHNEKKEVDYLTEFFINYE